MERRLTEAGQGSPQRWACHARQEVSPRDATIKQPFKHASHRSERSMMGMRPMRMAPLLFLPLRITTSLPLQEVQWV